MPYNPANPCRYPLCPNMAIKGSSYCKLHQKKVQTPDDRLSAAQRGYDSRWRKLRKMYLMQNPLCEICKSNGAVRLATLVHHRQRLKDNLDLRLYWDNLQSLCIDCHAKITAEEKKTRR